MAPACGSAFFGLLAGILLATLSTLAIQSQGLLGCHGPYKGLIIFYVARRFWSNLYLLYYGLPQFSVVHDSIFWPLLASPAFCAILALALNSNAYTTVLLQGAVRAIPKGENEAAEALGFSKMQLFWRIQLKRVLLNTWPAYSNEVILIFKATAIASTITVLDLMGVTRQLMADTYRRRPSVSLLQLSYICLLPTFYPVSYTG